MIYVPKYVKLVSIEGYNRVGRGITPPTSHTTVHALAHGGFL